MIKNVFITCLLICFTKAGFAQAVLKPLQVSVSGRYERQDLSWSIAGNQNGQNPNIYSELKWKDVGGSSLCANIGYRVYRKVLVSGYYQHLFITSGTVTDHDYNANNRTNPVYAESFDSDKGFASRWGFGLGYALFSTEKFELIPAAGYEVNRQSLYILDRTGNFPELNSTYKPVWKGPFVKAAAVFKLYGKLKFTADAKYSQYKYNSTADWNVIQTFQHPVSYRHTANAFGLTANALFSYSVTQFISANLGAGYFYANTGTGIDELYLSSGGSEKTQLNGVTGNRRYLTAGFTVNY